MSPLQTGQLLHHYRILDRIGRGGMGEVYAAEDIKLSRRVAIKLLPTTSRHNDQARVRLLREARSASALNHPNIVTIYSIEEIDEGDFLVMEYVEGETLAAMLKRGPLDLATLLDVGAQIAEGLAVAHAARIIHRDVKPANILVTPAGRAKILDFGLAKPIEGLESDEDGAGGPETAVHDVTRTGVICGTAAYMSPEQTRNEPLDERTDIFSLGCVLYEAATGRAAFDGPSALAIMHDVATAEKPPPSSLRPGLPRELDAVVARALAKNRDRRFASAAELAEALGRLRRRASGPLSGPAEPARDPEARLVGRERELRRLGDLLGRAAHGSGRVVLLAGEPGIGKSALADEFLRRAAARDPSLVVARGRCVEQYGTGEAYLPFLDTLHALLSGPRRDRHAAILIARAPTWCLQFPTVFASTGVVEQLQRETIGATKERMLREFGDALEALAEDAPVALVLEDIHWADASSADLLRHIAGRASSRRLLVVGTYRPEDAERTNQPVRRYVREMLSQRLCEVLPLGGLAPEHLSAYLDARFAPNAFPPEFCELLERKTEGHPLFATSFLQFLVERGALALSAGAWTLTLPLAEIASEIPESVRSMIGMKIEALDPEDRKVLQFASVEGETFTSTLVAELLDADELELEERFARLDRVHRLVDTLGDEELPDGALATRYRFTHALYRDVLYDELVSKRRVALHRRAGERLLARYGDSASRIAAQLAVHFEQGRDFARAVEYLSQAGDNASRVFANDEAIAHYGRALELVERLQSVPRSARAAALLGRRGAANLATTRFAAAGADFASMADFARALDNPALECEARTQLAKTLFFAHRVEEMEAEVRGAMVAADRAGVDALRAESLIPLALKHVCYGELDEAAALGDEIVRLSRTTRHKPSLLSGLIRRGSVHFFHSEYELGRELMSEALALASELRDGFAILQAHFELGLILGNLGRVSEALALLGAGAEMARRNGDHFWLPRFPNCVGWLHRELQDFEGALRNDREGVEVSRADRVLEAEANSLINLGADLAATGKGEQGVEAFEQVEEIFERDSWFRWRYNVRLQASSSEYWLGRGKLDRASRHAALLLELATRYSARKYVATAHKLLAEVAVARGDAGGALASVEAALEVQRQYPAPLLDWRLYGALGRLRAGRGDDAAAREAFERAVEIAMAIASNVDDDRLRETFLTSPPVREVCAGALKTS